MTDPVTHSAFTSAPATATLLGDAGPERHAMNARLLAALACLALASPAAAQTDLGRLSANPYAPDSLSNPYGAGSPYAPDGVNNPYSTYGSPYSSKSATNPFATEAPLLFDSKGNFHGTLSTNPYDPNSIANPYGRYGSPYSPDSIHNPYGAGSPYAPDSPNNPYGKGWQIIGR